LSTNDVVLTSPPAVPRRWSSHRVCRTLLAGVCAAYAAGAAAGWGSPALADFMGDFGLAAAALTAALSCWVFACALPGGGGAAGGARAAWLCFGGSSFTVAVGNGIWGWYEVVRGVPVPSPGPSDFVFLCFAPLAILGLLLLAKRPRNAAGWLCLVLDGWLIAGSLLTLSWSLALARAAEGEAGSLLRLTLALAYPVMDILLISLILGLRFQRRDGKRAAVHTATVALALTVLCDALFTTPEVHGSYRSGQFLDAGWFAGSMLLAWAPWSAGGRAAAARVLPAPPRVATAFSALTPYVAAGVCTAGLLCNALGHRPMDRFVLVTGCTVVFALILRQAVMLLDNIKLTRELADQERHFRSLVQGSSDVIMIAGPDGTLRYVSDAAAGVYGRRAEELVGTRLPEHVHPDDLGHVLWEVQRYLTRSPEVEPTARIECRVRSGSGEWLHVESTVNRYQDGLIFNSRDVSERVRLQAQLRHHAFHDPLTDLPNRALFTDRVQAALALRPAPGREVAAVLYLDLDGFKAVNDTAGHQVGDELLTLAARRLREAVRAGDTVARLGGDEFAALVTGCPSREQVAEIAERLRAAVSEPYWIGGEEHAVAASIGIAHAEPGIDPAELLRNADLAMYRAKSEGKGRVACYTPELRAELARRTALEERLRLAVREGRFTLLHQPVVDLRSGEVVGVAAQPRWRSAQGALLTPAEFEGAGPDGERGTRFARWTLEHAVRQAADRTARLGGPPLPVTVRIPAQRLAAPGMPETVESALRRSGLPSAALVLEVTGGRAQDARPERFEELVRRLVALKRLGVQLSLDGLGGGAAPLSGLRRLPLDLLTVERAVVQGAVDSAFLRTLACALLRLGREAGLITVADGVDLPEQAVLLRELGCRRGQGALFGGALDDTRLDRAVRRAFPVPRTPAPDLPRVLHPSSHPVAESTRTGEPGHPAEAARGPSRARPTRPRNAPELGVHPAKPCLPKRPAAGPYDETPVPPA
jgi:diguanylate cyclase (GGDEF)-like protein/PAS domain S-box-containing protein